MIKKIIKYSISCLLIVIIILLSYFVTSSVIARSQNTISSFFGYSIAYVPTNSMYPTIEEGSTIIFSQSEDYNSLNVGDIVIYKNTEEDIFVVHRIKSGNTTDGFVMQGDNNSSEDTNKDGTTLLLTTENYVGKYIKTVTVFSINSSVSRTLIFMCSIFIFVFIIASEAVNIKHIRKEKHEEDKVIDEDELKKELLEEIKKELKDGK